jgi:hypothetical protein
MKMKKLKKYYLPLMVMFMLLQVNGSAQDEYMDYQYKDGKVILSIDHISDTKELNQRLEKVGSSVNINDSLNRLSGNKYTSLGWELIYSDDKKIVYQKALNKFNSSGDEGHIFLDEDTFDENNYNLNVAYGVNRFKRISVVRKHGNTFTFKLIGKAKANSAYLSGTFNNWSTTGYPMKKVGEEWQLDFDLSEGKHLYKFIVDGSWITDPSNQQKESDYEGNTNSVFFNYNYNFELDSYQDAKKVYVAGSFNDWRESELLMIKKDAKWQLPLYLSEGIHSYKFIVDGSWITDPENKLVRPDGNGNENSILFIGKPEIIKCYSFHNAQNVILSGQFNNWNEAELDMTRKVGYWEIGIPLKPGNYEYKYIVDGQWYLDKKNPYTIGYDDYKNSILVVDGNYTFKLKGYENAKNVLLTGTFNNWSESGYTMNKVNGEWIMTVYLPKGKTRYKFIVDGEWIKDPKNPLWEDNQYGSFDSILWIK